MTGVGVGVIGAGVISETYLEHLTSFPDIDVVIVGDLDVDRAAARARAHAVPEFGDAEDVLSHPDVRLVVNLTVPAAHLQVSTDAVAVGKHVWSEKPLALSREDATGLLTRAASMGVRVGCAPDTLLGPGFQTAKRAIAAGLIGQPLFAQTGFQTQGPDLWHPNPGFLFAHGAGPMLDMGPYYVSALVSLLGPVVATAALGSRAQEQRIVRSGPDAGARFPVEVLSTVQVLTSFETGVHAQSLFSFDSALERHGLIEIHGTEGSIRLPDPGAFAGRTAYVKPLGVPRDGAGSEQLWLDIPEEGVVAGRGLGVLDMVRAIEEGRPHVASGELGVHVLDVLLSAEESVSRGEFVAVTTPMPAVPLLSEGFDPYASTLAT